MARYHIRFKWQYLVKIEFYYYEIIIPGIYMVEILYPNCILISMYKI